jgi:para-nitrobenzyl esterase
MNSRKLALRPMLKTALTTAIIAATATAAQAQFAPPPVPAMLQPIQTDKGQVKGYPGIEKDVVAFVGIPFGRPPVGDLRWKAPQPVSPWQGVLDAKTFKPACIQKSGLPRYKNAAVDEQSSPGMSEDCLYLNVWTGAKAAGEKRPVMLWLYGGAYTDGGGNSPYQRGDHIAANGAVFVSMNYRLGPLGFFVHPDLASESGHNASGNYALADVIAVLHWIKDNIEQFGGDPDNVTIFGQSAGAAMAGALIGSPEAAGLFQRAIPQSGGYMALGIAQMAKRDASEKQTADALAKLGNPSLADLRAMPAIEAFDKLPRQGMIIDGWIIPQDVSITVAQGKQNPVDILTGSNGNEFGFTGGFGPPVTAESWKAGAEQRWKDLAELGMAAYPAATDEEARKVSSAPGGEAMAWHQRLMAEDQAKLGKSGYQYFFVNRPHYDPGQADNGTTHAGEVAWVMGTLDEEHLFPDSSSRKLNERDPAQWAFSDQVIKYWVNFARTGNPNGEGLPYWPSVAEAKDTVAMLLTSAGSAAGDWSTDAKLKLFSATYKRDVLTPLGLERDAGPDGE